MKYIHHQDGSAGVAGIDHVFSIELKVGYNHERRWSARAAKGCKNN